MVTIEKLRERREAREIEDLKGEVVLLKKQLATEREKLEQEKKNGKEGDRKVIEKEIVALEKQVCLLLCSTPFLIHDLRD